MKCLQHSKKQKMYPDYSNKNMMCKDTLEWLDGQKQKWLKQEFC